MIRGLLPLLVACGRTDIDREAAAKLFREIPLETAPGLSGLASDDSGGLWTIAERHDRAYRITPGDKPVLEAFDVETPDRLDLEGIAWLGNNRFALGTEGRVDGVATVLLAERRDRMLAITGTITLPAAQIGIELPSNHGAEGLCGSGGTIIVAIEGAGTHEGRRFAPIVRIANGAIVRTHRMWLATATGKISAIDCTIKDGVADVIAIERHFEVTKILRFTVPDADGDITPTEALDLGPVLKSRLNLEGIAISNGRTYAIVDNQWKAITGPSLLLEFIRQM